MKKILTKILLILIIILSILLYSRFIGTKGLKVNELIIKDNIPESYDGLKIVHLADIHYKKVITEKEIKNLIKKIQEIKPDLIIITGDLTDKDYTLTNKDTNFLIKQLKKLESKFGTFAILGDQDFSNQETVQNIYIQSNITLLKNNNTIIQNENNNKILLGGLDSSIKGKTNIKETLTTNKEVDYKIILTHEPDITDKILNQDKNINLILSSHSINGSINIPIIKRLFLPTGAKKYFKPFYQINNTKLYITNGIGVNNLNFRFLNKPSIQFYRLKKKY